MCTTAEVRINKGNGAYIGTREELTVISTLVQHYLMEHELEFTCTVSNEGFLVMEVDNPLASVKRYVVNQKRKLFI